MIVFGQSGSIRLKEVVFCQKWLYPVKNGCIRAKVAVFGQSGCILAKMVVFGQSGFFRAKVVVFEQKWLYSGKSGCIRAKVVVIVQSCCNRAKVVLFGQSGLVVVFRRSGFNREGVIVFGKVVVIG